MPLGGKVGLTVHELAEFGKRLCADDEVVLEATGNTAAIVHALAPHVAKVIIANPLQVRAIAHARVKTDKIDATVLAQLHASGFLPSVWMPKLMRRRYDGRLRGAANWYGTKHV